MKKCLFILLMLVPMVAGAQDKVEIDGIWYYIMRDDNTAIVTNEAGIFQTISYSGPINIPSTVIHDDITYNVTSIDNEAFYGCSNLTSVNIPNSVTYIGGYAFYNCSSLVSVNIPNSVTNISYNVFEGCI